MLPTVRAIRYVAPLREGGSLPGLMETDDLGTYVVKYRGAGQGPKALVSEVIAGEIGRALGLPVPEAVLVQVAPAFGRLEIDPEVGHLLRASEGLNYGLDYLPGSITFDPLTPPVPDRTFSADVVWLDAFVSNPDRTARNTNLLDWHGRTWLIDHGASLYFHHTWGDPLGRAAEPFERLGTHVLLPFAGDLEAADRRAHGRLDRDTFVRIVGGVPEGWLASGYGSLESAEVRAAYVDYLDARLQASRQVLGSSRRA